MKSHCSIANIFTLDLANISNFSGILELLLPFFNEFANLFNITLIMPLLNYNIYPHHDTTSKLFFDVIALIGICLNVAKKTQLTGNYISGLFKGLMYLIFAFAIPNLYMDKILSIFGKNNYMKLAGGFLVIYLLEICIHSFICIYDKSVEKSKTH